MLLVLAFAIANANAQNRERLENQRKKLIKEIRATSQKLKTTQKNKETTLLRYTTLQTQILKRQELLQTLRKEVELTTNSIERANFVIEALTDDVARLKEEYSEMVRLAYRQKLNGSPLLFIFSSSSFNEAFRRWQYLKQYDEYRQRQAQLIVDTQNTLSSKANSLEERKIEKQKLLESEERQTELLALELNIKEELLQKLKKDESRLADALNKKQVAHAKLNNTIEAIIRKEMEKRRKAERNNAVSATNDAPSNKNKKTAPGVLTKGFLQNKGQLPWPVAKGTITSYFGKQPHPSIKTIMIANNGIDIQTAANAEVTSVHKGKVVGTQFIPGYDYMIIIQHGSYYTVYSHLAEVFLSKGESVKKGQSIGKAALKSNTNKSQVHFEIWKEKTRLNPTDWIVKK